MARYTPISIPHFRGLFKRVAYKLAVDPSYVSRVAHGERRSTKISDALQQEIRKLTGKAWYGMGFHIIKIENGTITWFRSASTVKAAKAEMKIAASVPGEYMVLGGTKYQRKRIFLVGYDPILLNARAALFRRLGHDVKSALGNEAAISVLRSLPKIDLFVVGHKAPEQTRREMVTWLRVNFPTAKVVALNPGKRPITNADFNVVWGKHEWLLLAVAAIS